MNEYGHLIFAQNSDINYLRQAYSLALSIKIHNKNNKTCLMTNDSVPLEYLNAFDHIVKIPWGDLSDKSVWKIENRWKLIYSTPFKYNIVYDADMLLLNSNDHYWYYLTDFDFVLTDKVYNYKKQQIKLSGNPYRKVFEHNDLPDVYFGLHYFKKSNKSFEFYKWLEVIIKNWSKFTEIYTPKFPQKNPSLDVASALATKFMDIKHKHILSFTHMKPLIQSWDMSIINAWTENASINFSKDLKLYIGNNQQTGVFHYVEDEFLTDQVIDTLRDNYDKHRILV